MAKLKEYEIKITGSGTVYEIAASLKKIADQITAPRLSEGDFFENATLAGEIYEIEEQNPSSHDKQTTR